MLPLSDALQKVLTPFACLFTKPTWQKAQVLLVGAILAPRKRTVTAALRVLGLARQSDFATYHQVLNRASWSAFKASRILLGLLLSTFDTGGALVFGIDETLERRWGKKIKAKGIYRDAVRSSRSHFVKCSGLRWVSLMWLVPIPWAKRVWALPVLTALAPSERYCQEQGIRHKKLTDWARQIVSVLRQHRGEPRPALVGLLCWLPERHQTFRGLLESVAKRARTAGVDLLTAQSKCTTYRDQTGNALDRCQYLIKVACELGSVSARLLIGCAGLLSPQVLQRLAHGCGC